MARKKSIFFYKSFCIQYSCTCYELVWKIYYFYWINFTIWKNAKSVVRLYSLLSGVSGIISANFPINCIEIHKKGSRGDCTPLALPPNGYHRYFEVMISIVDSLPILQFFYELVISVLWINITSVCVWVLALSNLRNYNSANLRVCRFLIRKILLKNR